MSGSKRKQGEEEGVRRRRTKTAELTPDQLRVQFDSVMIHLKEKIAVSEVLLEQLKTLITSNLSSVYENDKVRLTSKEALKADNMSGATVQSQPVMLTVTGSVNRVLSDLDYINQQEKELFQDIVAAKLTTRKGGSKIMLPIEKATQVAEQVDNLVRNLTTLSKTVFHNVTLVHGKSLKETLATPDIATLKEECQKLDVVLKEKIAMNLKLMGKLNGPDLKKEEPKPDAPASPRLK